MPVTSSFRLSLGDHARSARLARPIRREKRAGPGTGSRTGNGVRTGNGSGADPARPEGHPYSSPPDGECPTTRTSVRRSDFVRSAGRLVAMILCVAAFRDAGAVPRAGGPGGETNP